MNHKGVTPWIRDNWRMKVLVLSRDGKLRIYVQPWEYFKNRSKYRRRKYSELSREI